MTGSDLELLRAFVTDTDAAAFAELIGRHERWVFLAARRRLKDDHLADDARQAVFLLLAEKAVALVNSETPSVSAWLFHVMHFTCSGIVRSRSRQSRHEAAAGEMSLRRRTDAESTDEAHLRLLEDAIAELPPRDREAVVRRFYQKESFAVVGKALGITAEAARKRVRRALATCRASLSLEGIDVLPAAALRDRCAPDATPQLSPLPADARVEIKSLAKGTMTMVEQVEAMRFAVTSSEFFVRSVEDNLDFFEKLGFRRHFVEALDANGLAPRASLRGGHARIWLRRATSENPPAPGVIVYFWIDGGEQAVIRHREAIASQGVDVNQFFYDGALMNFTVVTPDGYRIGFFSTYQPHDFDLKSDG